MLFTLFISKVVCGDFQIYLPHDHGRRRLGLAGRILFGVYSARKVANV